MKTFLASLIVLLLTLPSLASASEEPPAPAGAQAIFGTDSVTVVWAPAAISPEDIPEAEYLIYGLSAGVPQLLQRTTALSVSAEVELGYESYGVAVTVRGVTSVIVKACVSVSLFPPGVQKTC